MNENSHHLHRRRLLRQPRPGRLGRVPKKVNFFGVPDRLKSSGEMNSPSAKDFGSSKILGRAAARFAGTLSYFRFTRILKLFLPVTVCSTAMEYLISSRPPRSLRLCRRALVWISTDSSP